MFDRQLSEQSTEPMNTALSVTGIKKAFGNNNVLHDVGFELPAGKVTVLMGANGAGKSTLVKILSGVHQRDAGDIVLFDQPYSPQTPSAAITSGVVTVHQSINEGVVQDLDIASNLLLEQLANGESGFWLDQKQLRSKAKDIAKLVGLNHSPDTLVHTLSLADKQLVSIARAMAYKPQVLILDEPTSSLSSTEADRLFTLIDSLREQGVAILYISHRMSDIRRMADRIITMRDGRITGEFEHHPLDLSAALNAMLGRVVDNTSISLALTDKPVLTLKNLVLSEGAKAFNLSFNEGEIVAITGLVGSGKSALAEILFGQLPAVSGAMHLDSSAYQPHNAAQAIQAGVFLCPRDRASNAIVPDFNITDNLTLPFLSRYSTLSWLRKNKELRRSNELIDELSIVCQSASDSINTLSGGNQQKMVVARWLAEQARVLILDEPFQGVDIQSRRDIGDKLRRTTAGRVTLVLVSELDEALEIADRIVVIAEHTLVGQHINKGIDMNLLLAEVASSKNHQYPSSASVIGAASTQSPNARSF